MVDLMRITEAGNGVKKVRSCQNGETRHAVKTVHEPLGAVSSVGSRVAASIGAIRGPLLGLLTLVGLGAIATAAPSREEAILTCLMDSAGREASVHITDTQAIYRYGRPGERPELTLSSPLMELDYRRKIGPASTIDEAVTFFNGDTAYRFTAGFRDKQQPDPTALRPFGTLTVNRAGATISTFRCNEPSIKRRPDRLLEKLRDIGRKKDSDGEEFPNYSIEYPDKTDLSLPCKEQFNVDSCWSVGVSATRAGDLATALSQFDKSCAAGFNTVGCYDAGKLYLHNRQLRNYDRARERLSRVCEEGVPGEGPYACKYLGWMSLTGIGAPRDLDQAWAKLKRACFPAEEDPLIDAEGCHFLAQTAQTNDMGNYVAYVALAMGCTDGDNAKTLCQEARTLYRRESGRKAAWIARCDTDAARRTSQSSCADLVRDKRDWEATKQARRDMAAMMAVAMEN